MMVNNTYKVLGPIETAIVARLTYEKKTIVTAAELDSLFKLAPKDRKQLVFRLKRKKILARIKPGVYVFSPLESGPEGRAIDDFLVPAFLFPRKNYYIGYSTLFNYYGFTEQIFQTIYVLNTASCKERLVCGIAYKFIRIPQNRFYGLETIKIQDTDVIISSKERTLIDLIYFNDPIGGIKAATSILKQCVIEKKCDITKLIGYATQFPQVKTRKCIGLTLEEAGVDEKMLRSLALSVQKTAISSLSGSRQGTLNKKWRVIVNAPQE